MKKDVYENGVWPYFDSNVPDLTLYYWDDVSSCKRIEATSY